ncbi:helix-turn-helix domain-containing protein [Bacillus sp. FJAT-50079]|uniref:helix-turn-helix domain-containing protein n=1 Tax=Bacillus sp. FJAT-50079 TaxID=2833577 RepID=UPI001BC91C41|nr:helix-turn-helix domain-containing protein [Bacillus sp. FJAT-50079]MBS4209726.1 helix-turn-helix domain-containing protein [Bacillus sp. FJAT-50079]
MTFLQAVIMDCLRTINAERTTYSVYHLLNGKKSSQTIQDAHLFQLEHLFKTVPQMKRAHFDEIVRELINKAYVEMDEEMQTGTVTNAGTIAINEFFSHRSIPTYVNGWKYQDAAILLWKRMTLLVQVVSHLHYRNKRYQTIQRDPDVYAWVKQFLKTNSSCRTTLIHSLYQEIHTLFSHPFPENPLVIIARLSGYGFIGMTSKQTAEHLQLEQSEYHYRFLNGLHYIIQQAVNQRTVYPIFYAMISDVFQMIPYTKSTLETYEYLRKEISIEQIAHMRNLRVSTIEDHIIEIALTDPSFSIAPFISEALQEKITHAAKRLGRKKLKPIKEEINDVSYFQIRLVLARLGEIENENV